MNQNNFYYPQPNPYQQRAYYQKKEKKEILSAGFMLGGAILAYLFMQSIAISLLSIFGLKSVYENSSMMQNFFNVIAVHIFSMLIPFGALALILKKRYISPIVPTKKVGAKPFWAWVGVGLGACYIANVLTSFVIVGFKAFGYELTKTDYLEPSSIVECLALIISTAIIPAIIEELSLRCFSMGILIKHGKGFAIFAVSIVFGLLHGNVIQFVFAFLVGLILAYVTIQTDSVIPAMVIHGLNNGLSVLQTTLKYTSGKKVSDSVVEIVYITFIALAIVGAIYLLSKRQLLPKKSTQPKSPFALSFGTKVACITPGMIVPILILIYISSKTIVKA